MFILDSFEGQKLFCKSRFCKTYRNSRPQSVYLTDIVCSVCRLEWRLLCKLQCDCAKHGLMCFSSHSWWLACGTCLLAACLSVAFYCILYLEWYCGIQDYDEQYPALIPVTTATFIAAAIWWVQTLCANFAKPVQVCVLMGSFNKYNFCNSTTCIGDNTSFV